MEGCAVPADHRCAAASELPKMKRPDNSFLLMLKLSTDLRQRYELRIGVQLRTAEEELALVNGSI